MSAKVIFSNGSKQWANNLNDLRERWRIRREEPINYAVPTELFKQDILKLSKDELRKLSAELRSFLVKVKKALRESRSLHKNRKSTLSRDEYNDLYYSFDSVGLHIRLLDNRFSELKDQYKSTLQHHFMDICREKLPEKLWNEIMDEANQRAEN